MIRPSVPRPINYSYCNSSECPCKIDPTNAKIDHFLDNIEIWKAYDTRYPFSAIYEANEHIYKNKHKIMMNYLKEQLIAAAMHPKRVAAAMSHYEDIEEYFNNV